MAEITTPQVVKLANERARVLADATDTLYQTAKRFQQEWAATVAATPVLSTGTMIADGSDVDGRRRITDTNLTALKTLADAVVTFFETGNPTRISQIQAISVNGTARF